MTVRVCKVHEYKEYQFDDDGVVIDSVSEGVVELPEDATNDDIIQYLEDMNYVDRDTVKVGDVDSDTGTIYIDDKKGNQVGELSTYGMNEADNGKAIIRLNTVGYHGEMQTERVYKVVFMYDNVVYLVGANDEQEALDTVADYATEKGYAGYFKQPDDEGSFTTAGNEGRMIATPLTLEDVTSDYMHNLLLRRLF